MNAKLLKISIINLTKHFKSQHVYDDLCLEIDNSKINLLHAPNGYGKSTLLKCIMGFLKYNGTINKNFNKLAYCPEKFIFPEYMKIKDFLNLIPLDYRKVKELLNKFKLDENKQMHELSKGMRQKVLLIFSLSKYADCYIFDEPLNGLDDESIKIFVGEIVNLYKKDKLLLISTHNPDRFKDIPINVISLNEQRR